MPVSRNDVRVLCPFYQYDEFTPSKNIRRIICEGVVDGATITSTFKTNQRFRDHIDSFCCEQFYLCPIYQEVEKKYENDSAQSAEIRSKRLIYAEDLVHSFDFSVIPSEFKSKKPSDWERMFRFRVNKTPTVRAEPIVHGKLKGLHLAEYRSFLASCANCGAENIFPCSYCRECGAKFDF